MPKFIVLRREVHVSHVEIEAETGQEAIEKVAEDEEVFLEYSYTLDPETWTVEEKKEKEP